MPTGCLIWPISGYSTAIVSPQGESIGESLRSGEVVMIADLDFAGRKRVTGLRGHHIRLIAWHLL